MHKYTSGEARNSSQVTDPVTEEEARSVEVRRQESPHPCGYGPDFLVEHAGIEPATSAMPLRRSPS